MSDKIKTLNMNIFILYLLTSLAWTTSKATTEKHHGVIFDKFISPGINSNPPMNIDVEIGDFLDISCPQYDEKDKDAVKLHIYDLDWESFQKCDLTEVSGKRKKRIFSCLDPINENKITIKFQQRSPNPFGFTFKEKETHYFVGIPLNRTDCKEAVMLKVYVKGKEPIIPPIHPVEKEDTITSSTSTSTTTTKKPTTTSKFISRLKTTTKVIPGKSSKHEGGGRGSSPSLHIATMKSLFLPLLTLWFLTRQNT